MQIREWLRALEPVVAEHAKWVNGGCQPEHGSELLEACSRLVEFAQGSSDGEFVPVETSVLAARLEAVDGDNWPPPAEDALWRQLDAVEDAFVRLKHPEPKRPESIAKLTEQKVPLHTICDIWGLVTPAGSPDLDRLNREIDKPGAEIAPDYTPPLQARQRQALASRLLTARQTQQKRCAQLTRKPTAPETVLQLARQGVAASQIAVMKGLSVETVLAECRRAGVEVKPDYSADVNSLATFDPRRAASSDVTLDLGPELEMGLDESGDVADDAGTDAVLDGEQSIEQQVVSLFESGLTQVAIASTTGLSRHRVQAILRSADAKPPTTAAAG